MHHGGLGVIRSLGRIGRAGLRRARGAVGSCRQFPVPGRALASGNQAQPMSIACWRACCVWPSIIGRPSVLITTDDAGAIFLAEHGRDLRRWFLFPDPPRDLPRRLAGKYSLYQACLELGVPCPRAAIPGSLGTAREFASAVGYPLIAKLTTPWTAGSGLRSTSVVADQQELDAHLPALRAIRRRADAAGVHPRRPGP